MKIGNVVIHVRRYADGRWGFDDYSLLGRRRKVRFRSKQKAERCARYLATLIARGRADLLTIDRAELEEFQKWKAGQKS